MSSSDIRKTLILLEQVEGTTVSEAAPLGFADKLKTAFASMFDDVAAGELQVGNAANQWHKTYLQYLGRSGKNADTGTVEDILKFFAVETGVPVDSIKAGIQKGLGIPATANLAVHLDTQHSKDKLGKTFLYILQDVSQRHPDELDPAELKKQAKTNLNMIRAAKKAAQSGVAPAQTAPASGPTATPVAKGTSPKSNKLSNVNQALSQLGVP